MIINKDGGIVYGLLDSDGVVSKHGDYAICLYYDEKQKADYAEMKQIQRLLKATDYKAVKYAEGLYTDAEYEPIRQVRQELRDRWNKIKSQFVIPTITEEEAIEAINKYILSQKEEEDDG